MRVTIKKAVHYRLYRDTRLEKQIKRFRNVKLLTAGAASLVMVGIFALNIIVSYAGTPPAQRPTAAVAAKRGVASRATPAIKPSAQATPAVMSKPVQAVNSAVYAVPSWAKLPFYTDPLNDATAYYQSNPGVDGAALIQREGSTPVADWFGDWTPGVQSAAGSYVAAAAQAGATPVLVLYNIPQRDCGSYSAGGASSSAAYIQWIQTVAAGIGAQPALVILEPDAVAGTDCLSAADQASRYAALSQAVSILKANAGTSVYIDAGNPAWQPVSTMASRLKSANIASADGFSLNVSNYVGTAANQSYGDQLSKLIGGKHYVIDTSRNGNGNLSPDAWCNNSAAALGSTPTANTGDPLNDALLWVKRPWESDGSCSGAPAAGSDYWAFAVQLARNAGWQ